MDILKVKQNGVWTTIPAIIGPRGIGITSITKTGTSGLTDTYTITFSDNTTTTFTLNNGAVPNLTIGTVTEGATAAATITGTAVAPILNLVLPNANVPTRVSQLENDSNYAVDANYVHTDNNYTNDEKIKLSTIAAGAEVNVNADWNAVSGDAQILNKPNLAAVATSGSYNDLSNKPFIPSAVSDLTDDSGHYTKPAGGIPASDLAETYLTEHQDISGKVDKITGKGLSTNDFTDAYKTKLDSALTSYTETDPTVPAWAKAATKPSYTAAEVGAPTVQEMNEAIANVNTMKIHICAQGEYNAETGVPTIQNPYTQTFYLVPGGEGSNLFIEWAYVNSAWERFGSADVDLSNYVQKTDYASSSKGGIIKVPSDAGLSMFAGQYLMILPASPERIKVSSNTASPITTGTQHASVFYGLAKVAGDTTQSQSDNAVGTYTDDAKSAIRTMLGAVGTTDYATNSTFGITKANLGAGIGVDSVSSTLYVNGASSADIKTGTHIYKPILPVRQHESVFYGLAKASGDTTQSSSSNAVGTYTDNAKASIKAMLGIQDGSTGTVDVTGTTPTITAVENTRYVCGEVTSLDFTPAASGICIVRFTSGSTVTVLTLPSTVKFPEWFDSTSLETNTIYEICVTDGVYGAVMSWAQ